MYVCRVSVCIGITMDERSESISISTSVVYGTLKWECSFTLTSGGIDKLNTIIRSLSLSLFLFRSLSIGHFSRMMFRRMREPSPYKTRRPYQNQAEWITWSRVCSLLQRMVGMLVGFIGVSAAVRLLLLIEFWYFSLYTMMRTLTYVKHRSRTRMNNKVDWVFVWVWVRVRVRL